MMQAAEPWHGYDSAICVGIRLFSTPRRSSLLQRKMRPVVVVVADVPAHQSSQMPFIEHDDMVEQVAATVANPALRDTVLPRASEAGALWPDAEALRGVNNFFIELRPRSKIRYPGAESSGKVSRSCWTTQALVGCLVTLQ
jgi:hypothetical protein